MSNVIRIKRSTVNQAPATLQHAELAFGANGDLWIGDVNGAPVKIGGVDVATQSSVDNAINYASSLVNDLSSSMNTADQYILDQLAAESATRTADIQSLNDAFNATVQQLNTSLVNSVRDLQSYVDTADTALRQTVIDFNDALTSEDAAIRTYFTNEISAVNGTITTVHSDLLAGLRDLQAAISAETSDRTAYVDAGVADAKLYTDAKIADLIGQAPELLNTLAEIANALGQDPNLAATVLNAIASEEAARVSADANLQTQIDGIVGITVPGLQSLISNLESNHNALVDSNAAEHATINAAVEETNRILWLTMGRVGDAENAMIYEQMNREAADTALGARIDALSASLTDVVMDGGEF